jgi:hypothetical protein
MHGSNNTLGRAGALKTTQYFEHVRERPDCANDPR